MPNEPKQPACPRILVVEDDPDQQSMICETLAMHYEHDGGRSIIAVSNAADCLVQDFDSIDIVLQDYHLPDMNGLDLVQEILKRADVPVIFVTGENSSASAAEAMQRGAADYVVKLGDYLFALPVVIDKNIRQHALRRENDRLQRELEAMLSELRVKNVQLEESLATQKTMASTDPLTGLANRRRFNDVMDRYMDEAGRYGFDLSVCMCDLDNFKTLNDALGHQVGDRVLEVAAEVVRSSLRSSDLAARYGGDEIVIVLPHTSIPRATAVCERIRAQVVARTRDYCVNVPQVTVSIGIASFSTDCPGSSDELIAMADRALYVAKDSGKDAMVTFSDAAARLANPAA